MKSREGRQEETHLLTLLLRLFFPPAGTVGDWRELFTVAQSKRMDEACARELAGSGLTFRTEL